MRIVVSGSTGLIGSFLVPALQECNCDVTRLVREPGNTCDPEILWDPSNGTLNAEALEGFDAVVHLSGANIAEHRWSKEVKKRLIASRVDSTKLLCDTLLELNHPPAVWVCASAVGYYGDRGDEWLDEDSDPGTGFVANLCVEWEAATRPAAEADMRVVNTRIGPVLTPEGGPLAKLLPTFRSGGGAVVGSGKQYMPWITLDDTIASIDHCIDCEDLEGPVNLVSPQSVTNREFTKALGKAVNRPTLLPFPAIAARLALGEMADELLLASARIRPQRLLDTGFEFHDDDLETALDHMLS
jgi:uncharacterized protein (TIGR01777 family)